MNQTKLRTTQGSKLTKLFTGPVIVQCHEVLRLAKSVTRSQTVSKASYSTWRKHLAKAGHWVILTVKFDSVFMNLCVCEICCCG